MNNFVFLKLSFIFNLVLAAGLSSGQDYLHLEKDVPKYVLPSLWENEIEEEHLLENWKANRRSEIIELFANQVYGQVDLTNIQSSIASSSPEFSILDGRATMREYTLEISSKSDPTRSIHPLLLVFLPDENEGPTPTIMGLNFYGNQTVFNDARIALPGSWVRNSDEFGITNNKATDASRGKRAHRWDVEQIIERGYGLAVLYYGDFDPDFDDQFQNGIHAFQDEKRTDESWGSIATWAWGLSRTMDCIRDIPEIDNNRVAVFGHSRLGKTALWAGATDERFALVISNDSGCGGAALSKRKFGETVQVINTSFPHWFCTNFTQYNEREDKLPLDQHMLMATVAPRPLYVASAVDDLWADPRGEYLSLFHASDVYQQFDSESQLPFESPEVDQPIINGKLGYHIRTGKHDVTPFDWKSFLDFADIHLGH